MVGDMETSNQRPASFSVLTDRQQVAAATILAVCLLVMLTIAGMRYARRQKMIDIERPFEARQIELQIDINHATWPELTLLPEVSETMARRIMEYREIKGQFDSLDEIKQVKGIGPRTFELIQPYFEPLPNIPATAKVP